MFLWHLFFLCVCVCVSYLDALQLIKLHNAPVKWEES